jgi:hypothetical protein
VTAAAASSEQLAERDVRMSRWRRWLFNKLARWEEASLARSLGLPASRVVLVDLSADDLEG